MSISGNLIIFMMSGPVTSNTFEPDYTYLPWPHQPFMVTRLMVSGLSLSGGLQIIKHSLSVNASLVFCVTALRHFCQGMHRKMNHIASNLS